MTEAIEKEMQLRVAVERMEKRIESQQELVVLLKKLIEMMHQERCEHIHVGANGEGTFCYDCRKQLTP
ncbi:MAG: hypothetical protein NT098_00530 [Candidatus Parcubacteria bacterium]|nr:hypothetical protein [Candidatus Parcubacteria bacterium]